MISGGCNLLSKYQINAISKYVGEGYSANQIQVKLCGQHIGVRRTVLLAEVRRVRGQKSKANTAKYIPKKYVQAGQRARIEAPSIKWLRSLGEKQVVISGFQLGKMVTVTKRGSGKDLYHFILSEISSGDWDARPTIHS